MGANGFAPSQSNDDDDDEEEEGDNKENENNLENLDNSSKPSPKSGPINISTTSQNEVQNSKQSQNEEIKGSNLNTNLSEESRVENETPTHVRGQRSSGIVGINSNNHNEQDFCSLVQLNSLHSKLSDPTCPTEAERDRESKSDNDEVTEEKEHKDYFDGTASLVATPKMNVEFEIV